MAVCGAERVWVMAVRVRGKGEGERDDAEYTSPSIEGSGGRNLLVSDLF